MTRSIQCHDVRALYYSQLGIAFMKARKERAMEGDNGHIRLAIGSFDELQKLWSVVSELCDNAFEDYQICLAGLSQRVEAARRAADISSDLEGLGRQLIEQMQIACMVSSSGESIVASGWLLDSLKPERDLDSKGEDPKPRSLILMVDKAQIESNLANGHVVLGVGALTADQQQIALRILLKHSDGDVQSHELGVNR